MNIFSKSTSFIEIALTVGLNLTPVEPPMWTSRIPNKTERFLFNFLSIKLCWEAL